MENTVRPVVNLRLRKDSYARRNTIMRRPG
jgi:hypothetical protein